ncbi:MAG: amidohydrolase family protein [Myxococcota bacterium]
MTRWVLLGVLVLAGCGQVQLASVQLPPEGAAETLFRDVRVFDGTAFEDHRDVWVRHGAVHAVGATGSFAAPATAEVVEGRGRTLLPGLIDCHVHLMSAGEKGGFPPSAESISGALLFAGITTVLVTAGGTEVTDLVNGQREGKALAPRLFTAGMSLSAPGGHPAPLLETMLPWPMSWLMVRQLAVASTGPEARARVRETAGQGGHTFYKIIYDDLPPGSPHLSADALLAAVDEAKRQGLRPIVHANLASDTIAAVDVGASLLVHVPQRELLSEAQAAHIVAAGIPVVSTVSMLTTTHDLAGREPTALERAVVDPEQLRRWRESPDWELPGFSDEIDRRRDEVAEIARTNFRRLREAGARILVGTDSGVHGVFPGVGLHNEMRLLRSLGMPELDILRAVTREAADFLDPEADFGRIKAGARADLLLVDGDPLSDIGALAEIEAVYVAGRRLERIGLR